MKLISAKTTAQPASLPVPRRKSRKPTTISRTGA